MKRIALLCVGLSFVLFGFCGSIEGSRGDSAGNKKIGTISSLAGQFVKKTRPVLSEADREKLERQMRRAVVNCDIETAKKCLEAGVDINMKDGSGDNLLYLAVDCEDSPEMFQLLLDCGIKKDVPDRDGVTPLEYLVKKIGFIYPTDAISDQDRNKLKMLEAILKERDEYETLGVKVLKKSINELINSRMSQIAADAVKILVRAFIFIDSPSGKHLPPDRISIEGLFDFLKIVRIARRSNAKYPSQYSNASNLNLEKIKEYLKLIIDPSARERTLYPDEEKAGKAGAGKNDGKERRKEEKSRKHRHNKKTEEVKIKEEKSKKHKRKEKGEEIKIKGEKSKKHKHKEKKEESGRLKKYKSSSVIM